MISEAGRSPAKRLFPGGVLKQAAENDEREREWQGMKEITRKQFMGGPSPKSVKRVCREVHELTHSRNVLLPVETVVERVNRLLKGWGAFYSVDYPSRVFRKVNHYVLKRMARFLNRKSQRYYRLKFAGTYCGEMTHYGLCRLAWADVRRAR